MTNISQSSYVINTKDTQLTILKDEVIPYLNVNLIGIINKDYAQLLAQSLINLADQVNVLEVQDNLNNSCLLADTTLLQRLLKDIYGNSETIGLVNNIYTLNEKIKKVDYQLNINNNSIVMLYTRTA